MLFIHAIQTPLTYFHLKWKTALKTLTNYQDYIKIPIETSYTNGVLEGINTRLRVIKRIALDTVVSIISKLEILIIHKYTFERKNKRNQTTQRSSLIPLGYIYRISSPTPVDKLG